MEQHSKYDLVIFDVDGTVLDTTEGVLASVKHTIRYYNFPMLSDEILKTFIGPPIQNSFAEAYNLQGAILQDIATVFRNQYKNTDLLKAVPYPGIYDVFRAIKDAGKQSAIATYKRQDYAKSLLEHFGFQEYTPYIYGADHENKLKKRDIIEKCILDSGVRDLKKVVMVGDSDNDAIGADAIGVDFIGVTYGFGFHTTKDVDRFKNVACVQEPKELIKYL